MSGLVPVDSAGLCGEAGGGGMWLSEPDDPEEVPASGSAGATMPAQAKSVLKVPSGRTWHSWTAALEGRSQLNTGKESLGDFKSWDASKEARRGHFPS